MPLSFGFLVYEDSGSWVARSVLTSHFAEGASADEAVARLTRVIDASLSVAMENGLTPEEWDDAQVPTQRRFLSLFMAIVAQGRAESKSTRLSGGKIEAQTSVARVEKAA